MQTRQSGRESGGYTRVSALPTHFMCGGAGKTERAQKYKSSTQSFEFLIDYIIILVHLIVHGEEGSRASLASVNGPPLNSVVKVLHEILLKITGAIMV